MNYIQETRFMKLYEELSVLNEAEAALVEPDGTVATNTKELAVDIILNNYFNRLKELYPASNEIIASDIVFCLPEMTTTISSIMGSRQPLARVIVHDNKPENTYLGKKSEKSKRDYTTNMINSAKIDLNMQSGWLCFGFILKGPNKNNRVAVLARPELVKKIIADIISLDNKFKVDTIRLAGTLASSDKKIKSGFTVCVPFDETATVATLEQYYSASTNLPIDCMPAETDEATTNTNIIDFTKKKAEVLTKRKLLSELRFEQAQGFIEYFINSPVKKQEHYIPGALVTEADIRNCAFNIKDLVNVYRQGDVLINRGMEALLAILGSKVGRNTPKNSQIVDWKSVQYLHNACQQETTILTVAENQKVSLIRNADATGLNGDNWLLFAQGSSNVRNTADFNFICNGEALKVDAKIYYDTASENRNADKPTAHDAVFLIEYIISNVPGNRWKLKVTRQGFDSTNSLHVNAYRELRRFVQYLNNTRTEFYRINRNLQDY